MARATVAQKLADRYGGLLAVHAVEVELILDHPVAAAQLSQDLARKPFAQENELFARIDRVVDGARAVQRFLERGALVAARLARLGRRRRAPRLGAPRRPQRLDIAGGTAEFLVVRRRAHLGTSLRRAPPCSRSPRW